jgi:hypothetical protein
MTAPRRLSHGGVSRSHRKATLLFCLRILFWVLRLSCDGLQLVKQSDSGSTSGTAAPIIDDDDVVHVDLVQLVTVCAALADVPSVEAAACRTRKNTRLWVAAVAQCPPAPATAANSIRSLACMRKCSDYVA